MNAGENTGDEVSIETHHFDAANLFRQLIENQHSAVVIHAPDTSVLFYNRRAAELLGVSDDLIFNKTAFDSGWSFARSDGSPLPIDEFPVMRVLATGQSYENLEFGINQPNTTKRVWVLVNAFPIYAPDGEISQVVVTFIDITARREAEDALRQLKNFHETVAQNLTEGIVVTDADDHVIYVNPAGAAMLGLLPENLVGQRLMSFFDDEASAHLQAARERRKRGESDRYEVRLRRQDGSSLHVLVSGSPRFENGRFAGTLALVTDVTSLARSQAAVEESREFFHSTLNALTAHIAILDENGVILEVNDAWRRFADENGLNDSTYGVGASYLNVCDAAGGDTGEEALVVAAGIRHLLNHNERGFSLEYPCHSPRHQRWFNLQVDSFRAGDARRIIVTHQDITARHLAEARARQEQQIAETLAEIAATVNGTLDMDQVLEEIVAKIGRVVPHTGANIMLIEPDGLTVKTVKACSCYANSGVPSPTIGKSISLDHRPHMKRMIEQTQPIIVSDTNADPQWVSVGQEWIRSFMSVPICADGKVIGCINVDSAEPRSFTAPQAWHLQAFADQAGVALHNAKLYQELENYSEYLEAAVTRRTEQLNQALAREMEMNQLKTRFLSMAAHDLRTPLATIQAATELFQLYGERLPAESKAARFTQIQTAIHEITALLDDILLLGRADAGKLQFEPILTNLADFCRRVVEGIELSIGAGHVIHCSVTGDHVSRMIDPKLLRHILNNLLSNAIKYSPVGSVVTLDVFCAETETVLRIADQGIGIASDQQTHLFEPFFRANNVGEVQGTGLGLAIVKRAVDLHGGSISVDSALGRGTKFIITLPQLLPLL